MDPEQVVQMMGRMLERQDRAFAQLVVQLERLNKRLDEIGGLGATEASATAESGLGVGLGSESAREAPAGSIGASGRLVSPEAMPEFEIPGLKIQHTRDQVQMPFSIPDASPDEVEQLEQYAMAEEDKRWDTTAKILDLQSRFLMQHDVMLERIYDSLRARV
jgi:hypothetical protein